MFNQVNGNKRVILARTAAVYEVKFDNKNITEKQDSKIKLNLTKILI